MSVPNIVKPLYAHPDKYDEAIKDEFGIIYTTSKIDRGSPVEHCLSKADLTTINYRTPQENTVLKGWHSGVKDHLQNRWWFPSQKAFKGIAFELIFLEIL